MIIPLTSNKKQKQSFDRTTYTFYPYVYPTYLTKFQYSLPIILYVRTYRTSLNSNKKQKQNKKQNTHSYEFFYVHLIRTLHTTYILSLRIFYISNYSPYSTLHNLHVFYPFSHTKELSLSKSSESIFLQTLYHLSKLYLLLYFEYFVIYTSYSALRIFLSTPIILTQLTLCSL